jgi:hypothetical protein
LSSIIAMRGYIDESDKRRFHQLAIPGNDFRYSP